MQNRDLILVLTKTANMKKRASIPVFLCNLLEHYDKALFKLALPAIGLLFFPKGDPITTLIKAYALVPLGVISRPIGAIFFGRLGDLLGRRKALIVSSLGLGLATLIISILPTYAMIGFGAPCLLGLCRALQNFFIPGQTTGGALLLLENAKEKNRSWISGCYESMGEMGTLVAALVIALSASMGILNTLWRPLFAVGASIALVALFVPKLPEGQEVKPPEKPIFSVIRKHFSSLLYASLVAGFAYANHAFLATLLTGLAPLVANVTFSQMMMLTTWMIAANMALLPLFGLLASKVGKEIVMIVAGLLLAAISPMLLHNLEGASLSSVVMIAATFLTLGAAITAPFYHWMQEIAPSGVRYTFIGLAKSIGLLAIGAPFSSIFLWVYRDGGSLASAGLFFSGITALLIFSTYRVLLQRQKNIRAKLSA